MDTICMKWIYEEKPRYNKETALTWLGVGLDRHACDGVPLVFLGVPCHRQEGTEQCDMPEVRHQYSRTCKWRTGLRSTSIFKPGINLKNKRIYWGISCVWLYPQGILTKEGMHIANSNENWDVCDVTCT